MNAKFSREPWNDVFEMRLWQNAGRWTYAAVDVDENGYIIWKQLEELENIPVFTKMSAETVEAIAREAGNVTQASDQTVEALADARTVRDRLLTLVEKSFVPRD